MTEKMIRVAGKEFPASNEKEIKETTKKLRHEDKEVKEVKKLLYALIFLNLFMFLFILPIIGFYYNEIWHIRDEIYDSLAYLSMKYSTMKSYLTLKYGINVPYEILDFMNEYDIRTESIKSQLDFLLEMNELLRKDAIYLIFIALFIMIGLIYLFYKLKKLEKSFKKA